MFINKRDKFKKKKKLTLKFTEIELVYLEKEDKSRRI